MSTVWPSASSPFVSSSFVTFMSLMCFAAMYSTVAVSMSSDLARPMPLDYCPQPIAASSGQSIGNRHLPLRNVSHNPSRETRTKLLALPVFLSVQVTASTEITRSWPTVPRNVTSRSASPGRILLAVEQCSGRIARILLGGTLRRRSHLDQVLQRPRRSIHQGTRSGLWFGY